MLKKIPYRRNFYMKNTAIRYHCKDNLTVILKKRYASKNNNLMELLFLELT